MSLLQEYYDSIARDNQAKVGLTVAQEENTQAQTGEVAANAASARNLQAAQAAQAGAGAQAQLANAGQVAANAASSRALDASRAGQNDVTTGIAAGAAPIDNALKRAQTGLVNQNIQAGTYNLPGTGLGTLGLGGGLVSGSSADGAATQDPRQLQGFETGGKVKPEAQIHGKGKPGPTDTVPVMLTPGEGVLNKGAMEHYGTDVVDRMNKMGMLRMGAQSEVAKHLGMPDPHAGPAKGKGGKSEAKGGKAAAAAKTPPSKRAGYATGTSKVPGPGASATPGGTSGDVLSELYGLGRSPVTPGGSPLPLAQGLTPIDRSVTMAVDHR